jgi:hypothetical protein
MSRFKKTSGEVQEIGEDFVAPEELDMEDTSPGEGRDFSRREFKSSWDERYEQEETPSYESDILWD